MKRLLLIIFLSFSFIQADYIKDVIVACENLKALKTIEPHLNKNSNKIFLPQECIILTKNAQITPLQIVEEKYIQILVNDLNIKLFTIKADINTL